MLYSLQLPLFLLNEGYHIPGVQELGCMASRTLSQTILVGMDPCVAVTDKLAR